MTTPSTNIYVHPGWASYTWTYAGATMPSGAGSGTVSAVAFDIDSAAGEQLARGQLQYSYDNGRTWNVYTLPVDGQGTYIQASGTVWRFQDQLGADGSTPNTFSVHYKLADGSVVSADNSVIPDNAPASLTGENDTMFSTLQAGAVVDLLTPVDTGMPTGGRWVIDSQSQPGLFSIAYNPATDTSARLVIANPGQLPVSGLSAAVTIHYYERYQVDTNGSPIAGQGVARTLTYTVVDGVTHDLPGFGDDIKIGAASTASANPSLATLSNGGFVAVWQGNDTVAGGAGSGLWAQLRDASGAASGAAFALTPNGDATIEGAPAVAALSGGRFAVAYSVSDGGAARIAYRVVEANGSAGLEHVLDGGASLDAAMPTIATLADGSFVVGWRSGGTVHVQQAALDGSMVGAQQVYGALSSAFSPSLAALKTGGYVVSWGEINDGNVYAATSAAHQAFVVNGDGYAASLSTAAPLPHVTTLANGNFVIAWDSYVNEPLGYSICDVFFQVYDSSGHALGAAVQANIDSGGGRYDAAVAALSDGSFVVSWQSQTGDYDGSGIFGRRFGADGSAVDQHEFEINQMRAGDQTGPDVVALANGGFATAWVDNQAGGMSVEARVFTVPTSSSSALVGGTQDTTAGSSVTSPAPVVTTPVVSSPVVTAPVVTAPVVPTPVVSTPVTTAPGTQLASSAVGTAGNNLLAASSTGGLLDGKEGIDTVAFASQRAMYALSNDGSNISVYDFLHASTTKLANVERLQFSDQSVALDIAGNGGEAYRLYQAAFNRTPDKAGLGYWIDALDHGTSLQNVAHGFVNSAEFDSLYGAHTSDAQYVDALYQNVLHRTPDAAGYDFWLHAMQIAPRDEVLVNFSESAENQAQVIGAIANGIAYTPWTGH
jgi:hypothetical protein